jgi:hypothetical protein
MRKAVRYVGKKKSFTATRMAERPLNTAATTFMRAENFTDRRNGSLSGVLSQYATMGGDFPAADENQNTAAINANTAAPMSNHLLMPQASESSPR